MLHWHARHRFCSNCGVKTDVVDAGWKRACPACKAEHFPRTDPVVIMLAVRGDRGLLGRSGRFAATMWSCLAGFVEPGESIEDAVRRETLEEAGITLRPREISLLAALAVSDVADDRLPSPRRSTTTSRWTPTSWSTAAGSPRTRCAAMLMRKHPDGLTCPPPVAIAHHIIRAWVESDGAVF